MIKERIGENSTTYTLLLNNIGYLYFEIGNFYKAEKYFLKSKKLREKIFGTHSIKYAQSLNNLSDLYKEKREFHKALYYFKKTLKTMEAIEFTNNRHYFKVLDNICWLQIEIGDFTQAENQILKKERLFNNKTNYHVLEQSKFLLDHARLKRKLNHNDEASKILNNLLYDSQNLNNINSLFYTDILYEKALLLYTSNKHEESFQKVLESITRQNDIFINTTFTFNEKQALAFLRKINREYNFVLEQLIKHFSTDKEKLRQVYKHIIIRKSIILEMTMIQNIMLRRYETESLTSNGLQERFKMNYVDKLLKFDTEAIISKLDNNSILLDFYYVGESNRYILFVISSSKTIQVFDLGDATKINQLIRDYRESIISKQHRQNHRELSRSLLSTLLPFMEKKHPKKLIVSPVNEISTLPFETLMDAEGYFLIERTMIKYISSVKDIVDSEMKHKKHSISIISDPDFDYPHNNTDMIIPSDIHSELLSYRSLLKDHNRFERLKGIKKEGEIISKMFSENNWHIDSFLTDKEATVQNIKNLKSSSVVHIITHAFFLQTQYQTNPLKDCGLVLSGINTILNGDEVLTEAEKNKIGNGVLSAYDLTFMNLENTELMVLSACQTGLGKIENGNGVLGFQRAVLLAGVKKMIMTLWDVSDQYSSEIMELFYKEYINLEDAEVALRNAKLKLIEKYYNTLGHADPFLWGGYICLSRNF